MKKILFVLGLILISFGLQAQSGSAVSSTSKVDATTGVAMSIDYAHHEIHSGSHYYIQGFLELDASDSFGNLIIKK